MRSPGAPMWHEVVSLAVWLWRVLVLLLVGGAVPVLSRPAVRILRKIFIPIVTGPALVKAVYALDREDAIKQLYDWERDRIFTLCKATGAAAITVAGTLLATMFDSTAHPSHALVRWVSIV